MIVLVKLTVWLLFGSSSIFFADFLKNRDPEPPGAWEPPRTAKETVMILVGAKVAKMYFLSFLKFSYIFGYVRTCFDLLECIRMHSAAL